MKILTATAKGQGKRKSDFFWMTEGEMVRFPFQCDRDKNNIDGGCGCRRSMAGLTSKRAGTTFTVTESPMTKQEFIDKLQVGFHTDWGLSWPEAEKLAKSEAEELLKLAEYFPVGTVLERRGRKIQTRT